MFNRRPFFVGLDTLGRTFLVTETMALVQFGIGEMGTGMDTKWEGSIPHMLLHGGVGCIAIEALRGNCASGFFAGVSQSVLAGSNLTDAQKLQLAPLVGSFAGFLWADGQALGVNFGGTIVQSGLENNYLTHKQLQALLALLSPCSKDDQVCIDRASATYGELSKAQNDSLKAAISKVQAGTASDTDRLAILAAVEGDNDRIADLWFQAAAMLGNGDKRLDAFNNVFGQGLNITVGGRTLNYELAAQAAYFDSLRPLDPDQVAAYTLSYAVETLGPGIMMPNIQNALIGGFSARIDTAGKLIIEGAGRTYTNLNEVPRSAFRQEIAWSSTGKITENFIQGRNGEALLTGTKYTANAGYVDLNVKTPNHKTFDWYNPTTREAVSGKTLNTMTDARLNTPSKAAAMLRRYVREAVSYEPAPSQPNSLRQTEITSKTINIVIPSKTTPAVLQALAAEAKNAASFGLRVIYTQVP